MSLGKRRTYETDDLRVDWDSSRCIHTGICLRTLPSVFDTGRRPWVDLSDTQASAVADAVEHCPTGALRYERLDGAEGERPRRPTLIRPIRNGPLLMAGDLDVRGPDRDPITNEARLTLCRCGLSHNQPFCDNSHRRRNWQSGPTAAPHEPPPPLREGAAEEPTTVIARRDASLEVRGDLRIYLSDERVMLEAGRVLLCRCGQSANKPFCDGSHERAEFRSRPAQALRERIEAETPAAFASNPEVPDPRAAGGA